MLDIHGLQSPCLAFQNVDVGKMKYFKRLVVCHTLAIFTVGLAQFISDKSEIMDLTEILAPPLSLIFFTIVYYVAYILILKMRSHRQQSNLRQRD